MTLVLFPSTPGALERRSNTLWLGKYVSQLFKSNHHVHTVKAYIGYVTNSHFNNILLHRGEF